MTAATSQLRLWLPVAAPPLAWATQGLLGWFIASHACRADVPLDRQAAAGPLGPTLARALIGGITIAALAVTIWAALVGLARWRSAERNGGDAAIRERTKFVATAGLFVCAALGLGLVWAGLPAWLTHVCGEAR